MNATITLTDMRFFAHHGVMEQERTVGNDFAVDLSVVCDIERAATTDELAGTIDYSALHRVVSEQMAQSSQLLENVAWRIATALRGEFPQIIKGTVAVKKLCPPFKSQLQSVAVSIDF